MLQETDPNTGETTRRQVALKGVNWFGMETPDRAPHGLWKDRSLASYMQQIKSLGFNAIRLPLSPQVIDPGHETASWAHSEAKDGRAMLERFLQAADAEGLWVLLDFHTYDPELHGHQLPGKPFGGDYSKADWLAHLVALAELARTHPRVIGIDLCNEPHALTWSEWSALATEAGAAILDANPSLLIVVNGVADRSDTGGYPVNWGGNLTEATPLPDLPVDKVAFSPHAYGPDVYEFGYVNDETFPANLPPIWERHFGHLLDKGQTLLIGEFGGKYMAGSKDEQWQDAFVAWLKARQVHHFFYWSWNPNSDDTAGILKNDWKTVDQRKMSLLNALLR